MLFFYWFLADVCLPGRSRIHKPVLRVVITTDSHVELNKSFKVESSFPPKQVLHLQLSICKSHALLKSFFTNPSLSQLTFTCSK